LSEISASSAAAGDPLNLLRARITQVRRRIRMLHLKGDHRSGRVLFEEYREWLCPSDQNSDLLLMRRLAPGN
jgi:hypothetical protein